MGIIMGTLKNFIVFNSTVAMDGWYTHFFFSSSLYQNFKTWLIGESALCLVGVGWIFQLSSEPSHPKNTSQDHHYTFVKSHKCQIHMSHWLSMGASTILLLQKPTILLRFCLFPFKFISTFLHLCYIKLTIFLHLYFFFWSVSFYTTFSYFVG